MEDKIEYKYTPEKENALKLKLINMVSRSKGTVVMVNPSDTSIKELIDLRLDGEAAKDLIDAIVAEEAQTHDLIKRGFGL